PQQLEGELSGGYIYNPLYLKAIIRWAYFRRKSSDLFWRIPHLKTSKKRLILPTIPYTDWALAFGHAMLIKFIRFPARFKPVVCGSISIIPILLELRLVGISSRELVVKTTK